jgi:glycosyltransferase involved in cell wall biosynthesis
VTAALTQGGGIGRYTRELIQALVKEGPEFDYLLFSARPPKFLPVPDSLPTTPRVTHRPAPIDERWLYRIWHRARISLPVQAFTGPIDLFHSPDFVLPPVRGRTPTLLTVHDLSFAHYPETFPPRLVSYLNQVVPRSIARADHILADSVSTQRDLASIWGVPEDKVTVLYSGVNERFQPVRDERELSSVRHKYSLGDSPFILAVGTIQPRKNYEMLVRAYSRIAEMQPHQLVIAGGRGWLFDGLLAEINRLGLADRVRFPGFVDDSDLPALYSAAELFVFPSLYEGFGLPLLEAMACGTPVITSEASSLPEVARYGDDQAAILLPPANETAWANTMETLLTDDRTRDALVEAGFRQANRFRWRYSARQLITLYYDLLARPHP